MPRLGKIRVTLLGAIVALALGVMPVFAGPPAPAATPIDDASGDPNAPGVNIIREVSSDLVVVRLNRGDRQAHFNVILRGIKATDITEIPGGNGLEGGFDDGIWGGCADELLTNIGKKGQVAMAKFYTCPLHDTIHVRLSDPEIGKGSSPAIKVVFTEGVLGNVDGVFVGDDDTTDFTNTWIPLYE